jgi:hypothetical protein
LTGLPPTLKVTESSGLFRPAAGIWAGCMITQAVSGPAGGIEAVGERSAAARR